MNKPDLYRDVLIEGGTPGFEEAVFRKTVAAAKRTHRTRVAVRTGLTTLAVALLALLTWPPRETVLVSQPPIPAPAALASHQTLTSQPFANILRTQTTPPAMLLATTQGSVSAFSTAQAENGGLRFIGDDELLSLFKGTAVALIHREGHRSEFFVVADIPK